MSSGGGEYFGQLLERVAEDPVGLLDRVLARAVGQLSGDNAAVDDGGGEGSPADVVASALGDRLALLIAGDRREHELEARNRVLATALGACDCWGEEIDCPVCDGEGAPGWLLPEPRLFAAYVRPGLRALDQTEAVPADETSTTSEDRKENGDGHHLARRP
jgi:hypothetical protein